jgi:peptidoglycan hydrolase-like protein with peptidoglycan-binding domain
MSTHYQTMRKSSPSRALTAAVAVGLTLAIVLVTLAATHVFGHHSSAPSASQSGGQVTASGSSGAGSQGHATPSTPSGSHTVAPSAAVKTLQQELAQLNYYEGPIDGIMGPQTVQAIQDLQRQAGLPQTGTMNSATEAALHNYLIHGNSQMNPPPDPSSNSRPTPTPAYSATVATLQKQLAQLNYYDGPINGIAGSQTTQAITYLQRDAGLPQTGQMNAATQAALNNFLVHGNNQMAG